MNINDLRELVMGAVTHEGARPAFDVVRGKPVVNNGSEAAIALALVYLGDAIRESCGDIGPALNSGLCSVAAELGSIASKP